MSDKPIDWFTSDQHFMHDNIIEYSNRPFANMQHMHDHLIEQWNECVRPIDRVWCLGDFAITWKKSDAIKVDAILRQLVGQKFLITGNHDRDAVTKSKHWQMVLPMHELKLDLGGVHKQRIVLCHYSLRTWNQMHRGAFMLHGHSHGQLLDIGGKTMDVGVDCHNYKPISIDQVARFMANRQILAVDHHVPSTKQSWFQSCRTTLSQFIRRGFRYRMKT
jgi:calcineurin-like phosphoesterase family protein